MAKPMLKTMQQEDTDMNNETDNIEDAIHLPEMMFEFYELLRKQNHLPEKSLAHFPTFFNRKRYNPVKPSATVLTKTHQWLDETSENWDK